MNVMTDVKKIDASQARSIAEAAQIKNLENAFMLIKTQAEMGVSECTLFNPISFEGVKKLMDLGFSVSEFIHPFEQRKMQKVTW